VNEESSQRIESHLRTIVGIITIALIAYTLSDQKRTEEVFGPIKKFLTLKKYQAPLGLALLLIPALVGFRTWKNLSSEVSPPFLSRTIHPAPPGSIDFKGKQIDLTTIASPYRELEHSDPEKFRQHVDHGRQIYYQNCFYCHGDNLDGKGMFAHGLDPLPANFQDSGTIAMLEEGFLFWRIAKGGPGLPEEATPWSSSMPAWENFLSEEDIWDVILFLYDFTGQKPRAREEHH